MNSRKMHKRYLAMLLVIVMAVSLCPAIPVFAADSGMDMVVDSVEYGWITAEPVNNGDGSVSFSIMTAGAEPEAKDLTTAQVYDLTNEDLEGMDAIDEANVVLTRIGMEVGRDGSMTFKPGVFAEVCYNAEGDVIDVRRVLQSPVLRHRRVRRRPDQDRQHRHAPRRRGHRHHDR